MKVCVLGANSMVGWPLFLRFREHGGRGFCSPSTRRPRGSGLEALDLTDGDQVARVMSEVRPDLVFHCAAICKVDKCEEHPRFAQAINVEGTRNVLNALPERARLVYGSSDHVFGGDGGPYYESTPPAPISFYGRTRVQAEEAVLGQRPRSLVVRLPLCVGPSYNGRSGHLDWLRYRSRRGLPMTIVRDEARSAVWTTDAAERLARLGGSELAGVRHIWARRTVSRPELARHLVQSFEIEARWSYIDKAEKSVPHLGRVELRSEFSDELARPLASALEALPPGSV